MPATDSHLSSLHHSGPDYSLETAQAANGHFHIAGVDEVGRGPLAGPVVAAAIILDPKNIPDGLDDSKKLTAAKREKLFGQILETSHVAWAGLSAKTIDHLNIRIATLTAMERAVAALPVTPNAALIDGRDVPDALTGIGTPVIKGDSISVSIAAASIVAKVIRDNMMEQAAIYHPQYGFERHKGYGSKFHRDQIEALGPCPLHRFSFAPIKQMISDQ